jgi:hypothetical protein
MKKFTRPMTWAQAVGRTPEPPLSSTPPCVGPGSYAVPPASIPLVRRRDCSFYRDARVTIPPPSIVTPGPGAYSDPAPKPPRPSYFFRGKTQRAPYAVAREAASFPSPADHNRPLAWPCPHAEGPAPPPRPRPAQRPRLLPGGVVSREMPKGGPECVGPGSYDDARVPMSRHTTINARARMTALARPNEGPAPDAYEAFFVDSRIPRRIREKREEREKEVNDMIGRPIGLEIPKRSHSVFQRSIERVPFAISREDVPGAGTYPQERTWGKPAPSPLWPSFGSRSLPVDGPKSVSPGPIYALEYPTPERKGAGTFSFLSKSLPTPVIERTPADIGPGTYDAYRPLVYPRQSPAFADASTHVLFPESFVPAPTDYTVEIRRDRVAMVHGMRDPVLGDWALSAMSDAPSPEKYTICRDLPGPKRLFPKAGPPPEHGIASIGPGSYYRPASLLRKSFNSGVPRSVSALV